MVEDVNVDLPDALLCAAATEASATPSSQTVRRRESCPARGQLAWPACTVNVTLECPFCGPWPQRGLPSTHGANCPWHAAIRSRRRLHLSNERVERPSVGTPLPSTAFVRAPLLRAHLRSGRRHIVGVHTFAAARFCPPSGGYRLRPPVQRHALHAEPGVNGLRRVRNFARSPPL